MRISILLLQPDNTVLPLGSGFITNKRGLFVTAGHVLKNNMDNLSCVYAAAPDLNTPSKLYKTSILYHEYFDPKLVTEPEKEKLRRLPYHQDICIGRVLQYKSDLRFRIRTKRPASEESLRVYAFYNPSKRSYPVDNNSVDLSGLSDEASTFKIKHREISILSGDPKDYYKPIERVENYKKYNNCLTLENSPYPGTSGGAVLDEDDIVVGMVVGGKRELKYSNMICSKYIRKRYKRINMNTQAEKDYRKVLEQLKTIDYSTYPYDDVRKLLSNLGRFGIVITTLHKGKRIIRARINSKKERYENIQELSFKPQEYNTTYQRASTPNKTMFYGSIVPEIKGKNEPDTARATTLFELSEFVRDTETKGTQLITFSVWEVVDDINLISLVHHKKFEKPTALSQKLQSEFEEFIKKYPDLEASSREITVYLGEQYAKPVNPKEDYNYMVSAVYSELVTEQGYDGVLYPSVKLAGEGINISVKPEVISSKIQFIHAGECTVYKNGKNVLLGNDTHSKLEDGKLAYYQAPEGVFVPYRAGIKQVGLGD